MTTSTQPHPASCALLAGARTAARAARAALFAAKATLLCLGAALALSTAAQAQQANHSVRVATYNAYLLSPLFKCLPPGPLILDCLSQITNQTEGWAQTLADRILDDADRFDILVLNEVWDENAKDILVERLKVKFPVYVKKLDAPLVTLRAAVVDGLPTFNGTKLNGEDSGLMLFARRGFTALALPSNTHRWGGNKGTLKASTSRVAFKLFMDYDSDDAYAAKGVGFIRLRHNSSRTVYNVAFTHLQADYPDNKEFFAATRKKQLADVRTVIEQTLAPLGKLNELLQRERLIVAGDLNVAVLSHGQQEWADLFNSNGSFFTKPLYDTWKAASPDASRGETNEVDQDRLDYVLASVEPFRTDLGGRQPMCAQHATVPVDFKTLESDHFMVHVDFNLGFHHCHPRIAYQVSAQELTGNQAIDKHPSNTNVDVTRIAYPGAMQWFRVNTGSAGTYTITRLSSPGQVKMDIYAPEDLTTPISRYNLTTVQFPLGEGMAYADKYALPKEYYIRISGPTRSWTGDYKLLIKRNNCASRDDACLLQPGMPQTARLTGMGEQNTVGQVQNEAWFRFDVVGQSDAGVAQTIDLLGFGAAALPGGSTMLVDWANPGGGALAITDEAFGRRWKGRASDGASGYIVMKQGQPGPQGVTVVGSFDTSLRILDFSHLICADETNPEVGSDDIYTRINVDGTWFRAPASGSVEFDCDNSRHPRDWRIYTGRNRIVYVDALKIRVLELDDTSPDDPSRERALPTLSPLETKREGVLKWGFSDGKYEFPYIVRKRRNQPVK
jgi:endonuclease/exonuclease/phosphatase family metal-dependent hydrolase